MWSEWARCAVSEVSVGRPLWRPRGNQDARITPVVARHQSKMTWTWPHCSAPTIQDDVDIAPLHRAGWGSGLCSLPLGRRLLGLGLEPRKLAACLETCAPVPRPRDGYWIDFIILVGKMGMGAGAAARWRNDFCGTMLNCLSNCRVRCHCIGWA